MIVCSGGSNRPAEPCRFLVAHPPLLSLYLMNSKNLASLLACLSASLWMAACAPVSVLRTPDRGAMVPRMMSASQFAALPPVPTRIRPGDTLRIVRDTHDAATLDLRNLVDDAQAQNYLVRPDGTFSFRYAGRVEAAGKTPDELALYLRSKLDSVYREPGVTVNIQTSPSDKVVIGGAVRNPATIDLNAVANLEQALFASGGLLTSADPRRVALLRLDEQDRYQVYFIDLSQLLMPGEGRASIALTRGDIVFVPKSSVGESADGVDLYFNQLLPFSRSLGVGLNKNID